jgi:nitrate/nitrite transport system substrate-binding protein
MREMGLTVPDSPMRKETIFGREFDPAQAAAYLASFPIKR